MKALKITIQLSGPITPEQIVQKQLPDIDFKKYDLIVTDGRAPIWAHGYLALHYHPAKAIAINDPRLGFVVIHSHNPNIKEGTIINPEVVETESITISI